jgi:hypothetical protein
MFIRGKGEGEKLNRVRVYNEKLNHSRVYMKESETIAKDKKF